MFEPLARGDATSIEYAPGEYVGWRRKLFAEGDVRLYF